MNNNRRGAKSTPTTCIITQLILLLAAQSEILRCSSSRSGWGGMVGFGREGRREWRRIGGRRTEGRRDVRSTKHALIWFVTWVDDVFFFMRVICHASFPMSSIHYDCCIGWHLNVRCGRDTDASYGRIGSASRHCTTTTSESKRRHVHVSGRRLFHWHDG